MIDRFYRNINGVPDPHEYQETILGQEISQDNSLHLYVGSGSAYYRGGFTALSMMGNIESDHKQWMYLYNHKTNELTIGYDWGSYPFGDYHSSAYVTILRDGRILTISETEHNDSLVVKRSLKPYDITSFETLVNIIDDIAYPNTFLIADRLYMVGRSFPLIENAVSYSDDFGETWTPFKPILNTGAYSNYWAYIKQIWNPNKLQYYMVRRDMITTNLFDRIYFLQSEDGVNWSNVDGSYSRDIDVLKLSAADLENHYKVRNITPANGFVHAACQFNNVPFYCMQSPVTDGAMDFGYFDGSIWQTREITISGKFLRPANRMALLPTGENSFIFYCCEYETFASPIPNTQSPIIKITTSDNFQNFTHEEITTGLDLDYNVVASNNYQEFNKSAVFCLTPKVYGSGPDVDPLNSYANFKIVDVL